MLDYIEQIYFINLKKRTDRRAHILNELSKIFDKDDKRIKDIGGIEHKNGGYGCTLSHAKVIQDAIENNYKHILIFEDDFELIVKPELFIKQLKYIIKFDPNYNVFMLNFNHRKPPIKINNNISKCIRTQTASCYLVNCNYFEQLFNNFNEAIQGQIKTSNMVKYMNDKYWFKLQGPNSKFYCSTSRLGKQMKSYSNILNKVVDYKV